MKLVYIYLFLALSLKFSHVVGDDEPQTDGKTVNNDENNINNSGNQASVVENANENGEAGTKKSTDHVPSNTTPSPNNSTKNTTELAKGDENLYQRVMKNTPMLMRSFYVLLGVTSIVVLYFVVKAWRSKKRQSKSRKYGLITSSGADLEMEPLDQDVDDDDEMTMFERQK